MNVIDGLRFALCFRTAEVVVNAIADSAMALAVIVMMCFILSLLSAAPAASCF